MSKTNVLTGFSTAAGSLLLLGSLLGCDANNGPAGPVATCTNGTFEFVLHLTGYGDDVGQLLEVRVFEARLDDNREFFIYEREVNSVRLAAIPSGDFAVTFCVAQDVFHVVELYADHDGDGRYSGPTDDHSDILGIVPHPDYMFETVSEHLEEFPPLQWP